MRTFGIALVLASSFALLFSCAEASTSDVDDSDTADAGPRGSSSGSTSSSSSSSSSGSNGDEDSGSGPLPACVAPTVGRGFDWVRKNPAMISGLAVVMGSPSTTAVNEYFTGFHATAAHLWENGLPTEIAGWAAANQPSFRYVSWVHRDGTSVANGQVLGGAAPLPGRIGYQIGDEPLDQASLDEILAGAAAVKAADPDGLRIINLNDSKSANDLRAKAIEAADIDVLSYDHYTWGTGAHDGLMATRTAALAQKKPYWRYVKSFFYKKDGASGKESDLRWDALVGAVYGFTGTTWFVYSVEAGSQDLAPLLFDVGGDYAATKTSLYAAAATANVELANIGRTVSLLQSTDVRYVPKLSLPVPYPTSVPVWSKGAGGDPYLAGVSAGGGSDLLVGHFVDDCNEHYVMVQNQAHPGGTLPNNNALAQTVTLTFDFAKATDATLDKSAVLALDTMSGTVAPRGLSGISATMAKLDVQVDAGAVFFFKYKNARPFAQQ